MEDKSAINLNTDREVFDKIAPGWYNRRHRTIFRRELDELAGIWKKGRLLNIGCGHGADFLPFISSFELHGLDFSREMLRFARRYAVKYDFRVDLVRGDAASLPYGNGVFDVAIAVATYHHLGDREQRSRAFRELFRVLKPGGEAFVTVWNRWQPAFWFTPKDTYVKWRTKNEVLYRYYHLFSRRELEQMAKKAGFILVKSYAESSSRFPVKLFARNICLRLKKTGIQ